MRFMVLAKADEESEAGGLPDDEYAEAMIRYNEELARAGVLLAAEGLQPSSKGARIQFGGGRTTVIDGPFTEAKELVAGFWLIEVRSLEEAIEWVRRVPMPGPDVEGEIEIREVFELDDVLAPDLKARQDRLLESP